MEFLAETDSVSPSGVKVSVCSKLVQPFLKQWKVIDQLGQKVPIGLESGLWATWAFRFLFLCCVLQEGDLEQLEHPSSCNSVIWVEAMKHYFLYGPRFVPQPAQNVDIPQLNKPAFRYMRDLFHLACLLKFPHKRSS